MIRIPFQISIRLCRVAGLTVAILLLLAPVCRCGYRTITLATRVEATLYYTQRLVPDEPRLMLALSGGGDRGLAHIGVLEALEEAGYKPDGIVGTSMGALIGGLYAGGNSPAEIAERVRKVNWQGIMLDEPERKTLPLARKEEQGRQWITVRLGRNWAPVVPGAISTGQLLYQTLLDVTLDNPHRAIDSWNELDVPLKILATDLETGKGVIFTSGDMAPAIRGSISMPLLFDPFPYDSMQLIDGGITSNIPVEYARTAPTDVVLAVDATSPLRMPPPPVQPWHIVDQVTTILEQTANQSSLSEADLVIKPELGDMFAADPGQIDSIISAGREAMRRKLPELMTLMRMTPNPEDSILLPVKDVRCNAIDPPELLHVGRQPDRVTMVNLGLIKQVLRQLYSNRTVRYAEAVYSATDSTLTFNIQQTHPFTGVAFAGDLLLPDSILQKPFTKFKGYCLDFTGMDAALGDLLKIHRQKGFTAATITAVKFDTSTGELAIEMDAGRLSEIKFIGLNRVPEDWLRREIPMKTGRPITKYGLLKGAANLYATGLFRSVHPVLRAKNRSKPVWVLEMHVSEQPSPPLHLGVAYQDEQQTRGFVELVYPNPLNYAARTVFFAGIGKRDVEYRVSALTDKVFGLPFIYDLTFAYNMTRRDVYDEEHRDVGSYSEIRWGGRLLVGGQLPNWGLLTAGVRWEDHENEYLVSKDRYLLGALETHLAIDTQDRSLFPNRGINLNSGYDAATSFLGSERNFNKLWGSFVGYATPLRRHTLCLRINGATCDRTTPFDERFKLGGMYSFPGLHLDQLSGAMRIGGGGEYRFDLISRILADSYLGVRMDVAGIWSDPAAQIKAENWMHSGSLYFALDTMFGPIILMWGHLFTGGPLPEQDIIFIQIGNQF